MAKIDCKFLYESSVQARGTITIVFRISFYIEQKLDSLQTTITPRRYTQDEIIENIFKNN